MDDLFIHGGDEIGNAGEMRPGISGQRHEYHVLAAGLFNLTAGDDAARVCIEHDLQKNPGIIGFCASLIIAETGIEQREVKLVVDKVIQRIFEGAGKNLVGKVDGNELALGIGVRFVTGHDAISLPVVNRLPCGILQSLYRDYIAI